jgi:uncharacterized protein YndB with AHSA1/START domain
MAEPPTPDSAAEEGITITRVFDAPRERVWREWTGAYREVAEPERLVFTLSDQPGEDEYELVTIVLTELRDGRTDMLFQQRGRMSAEQYERAKQGWSGFFDRMAEHLVDAI